VRNPLRSWPRPSQTRVRRRPAGSVLGMNDAIGRASGEPMRCPNCGSRLVEVDRSEVLIDACPECRGIWLDRGELDKILVRERQMGSGDPDDDFLREVEGRPRTRDHRDQRERSYEHDPKKRKRRGFLEDLLDF